MYNPLLLDDEQFALLAERMAAAKQRLAELERRPGDLRSAYHDCQLSGDIAGAETAEEELAGLIGKVPAAQQCVTVLAKLHAAAEDARQRHANEVEAANIRERNRGMENRPFRRVSGEERAKIETEAKERERREFRRLADQQFQERQPADYWLATHRQKL